MEPIEFITTGDEGTSFVVSSTAMNLLETVKKPLVVVSVVGMYRTGKSYLLNRLMGRSDGFPLGATVQAKTKGIWMWVSDHPGDPNRSLLLLDTEGLHDPEKGSRGHDAWIFTLATLLSSVLVYNSKGTVDANALDGLYLASQLTEHVTVKKGDSEETGEEFGTLFPTLVWALRDHHLDLEVDGKTLTPSEYLEHCLKLKKGKGAAVAKYNDLRSAIKEFFVKREMFCFPVPTQMQDLKNLDTIKEQDLDKDFVKVGNDFTKFILTQTREKTVRGKSLNGSMLASLTKQYVENIEKGNVNIESSFDYVLKTENLKAIDSATKYYSNHLGSLEYPVSIENLLEVCKIAKTEANKIFLQSAILTTEEGRAFAKDLAVKLENIEKEIAELNNQISEANSRDIIKDLYSSTVTDLKDGKFAKAKGSKEYAKRLDILENVFRTKQFSIKKGPRGEMILMGFLQEKRENEYKNLLQTDEALSKAEKQKKEMEMQNKQAKAEQDALEKEIHQMHNAQKAMEQNFQENMKMQKEEFEKQSLEEQDKIKSHFDALLKNTKATMEAGFKEEANLLKEQLDDTRKRMDDKERDNNQSRDAMNKMMEVMKTQNEGHMKQMKELANKIDNMGKKKKGICVIS